MAKKSRECSSHNNYDINDAIQMMDDFIERRVHLIGYDIDDIDSLNIDNDQKQCIKNELKNNTEFMHQKYMGNKIYQMFFT